MYKREDDEKFYQAHIEKYQQMENEVEHRKMMRQAIHEAANANPHDPSGLLDGLTVMADNDLFQACVEMGWNWEDHWEKL